MQRGDETLQYRHSGFGSEVSKAPGLSQVYLDELRRVQERKRPQWWWGKGWGFWAIVGDTESLKEDISSRMNFRGNCGRDFSNPYF